MLLRVRPLVQKTRPCFLNLIFFLGCVLYHYGLTEFKVVSLSLRTVRHSLTIYLLTTSTTLLSSVSLVVRNIIPNAIHTITDARTRSIGRFDAACLGSR